MNQQVLDEFKRTLHQRRAALTEDVAHAESGLHGLSEENESEWSDSAQEERLKNVLAQLDARGREELGEIELALQRIADGTYSRCERCGTPIAPERLRALPTTHFCAEHAGKVEAAEAEDAATADDVPEEGRVPPDLANLSDGELEEVIWEQVEGDGRVEAEELKITCRRGVVVLGGALPSEAQRSILLQLVTDVLGFVDVADRIEVEPLAWQREDRDKTPLDEQRGAGDDGTVTDRELYGSEDVIESSEEVLTEPSSLGQPVPERE